MWCAYDIKLYPLVLEVQLYSVTGFVASFAVTRPIRLHDLILINSIHLNALIRVSYVYVCAFTKSNTVYLRSPATYLFMTDNIHDEGSQKQSYISM